uniref:Endonuclease/exonuclease/phosphatase domain-containing protein n=1 Tax=Oncorhynchus mykiss TaxID=8022 RepID=A0A8K9UXY5_ONCMY
KSVGGRFSYNLLDKYTLEDINSSVAFLQETHIGHEDVKLLRKVAGWKSFFTVFDSKSKGVAILIKDTITDFEYICHDEDYAGGYIVLFCRLYGQLFTLVNVYNHKDDHTILKRLGQYLKNTATGTLVVGGDFNTVLDPKIDRSGTSDNHQHKAFRVKPRTSSKDHVL